MWTSPHFGSVHDLRPNLAAEPYQVSHKIWSDSTSNIIGDGLVNDLVAHNIVGSLTGP